MARVISGNPVTINAWFKHCISSSRSGGDSSTQQLTNDTLNRSLGSCEYFWASVQHDRSGGEGDSLSKATPSRLNHSTQSSLDKQRLTDHDFCKLINDICGCEQNPIRHIISNT